MQRVYLIRVDADCEPKIGGALRGLLEAGCLIELAAVTGHEEPKPLVAHEVLAETAPPEPQPEPAAAAEPEAKPPSKRAKTKRGPDGLYHCPECDETFQRAQGLGAHRRTVHGVKGSDSRGRIRFAADDPLFDPRRKSYDCPICSHCSETAQGLKIHMGQKHGPEARARAKKLAEQKKAEAPKPPPDPEPEVEHLSIGSE